MQTRAEKTVEMKKSAMLHPDDGRSAVAGKFSEGCGVIYLASGEKFVAEAEVSLATLRRTNQQLPVILLTAEPPSHPEIWDEVIVAPGLQG